MQQPSYGNLAGLDVGGDDDARAMNIDLDELKKLWEMKLQIKV